ncbi:MAG: response regulator [Dermatophilaceae bacterium]
MSGRAPTAGQNDGLEPAMRRVLVVDDHRTFTDLLGRAIAHEPDLDWVGAVHTVEDAVSQTAALAPDAVIMDVQVGAGDGLEATATLVDLLPHLRVVVLTAYATASLLQRAMNVGASALLPKDGTLDDLLGALRDTDGDGFRVHPALLRRLLELQTGDDGLPTRADGRPVRLTAREDEVLHLLADGLDPAAIARRLGISRHTSRGYVAALLTKLDAHSQLEAVAVARRAGLLRDRV